MNVLKLSRCSTQRVCSKFSPLKTTKSSLKFNFNIYVIIGPYQVNKKDVTRFGALFKKNCPVSLNHANLNEEVRFLSVHGNRKID